MIQKGKKFNWQDNYKGANTEPKRWRYKGEEWDSLPQREKFHDILYLPSMAYSHNKPHPSLISYISSGIKSMDESFKYVKPFPIMNHLVQTQFKESKGYIDLEGVHNSIDVVCRTYSSLKELSGVPYPLSEWKDVDVVDESDSDRCTSYYPKDSNDNQLDHYIGKGVLLEDYCDSDNDPYETAGGFRNWKALKGIEVKYYLNSDLTINVRFDSNCLIDHYNNNIAGLSTGGGTTRYKIGDRVERRSATNQDVNVMGIFRWRGEDFPNAKIETKATKLFSKNIEKCLTEFQPELLDAHLTIYNKPNIN